MDPKEMKLADAEAAGFHLAIKDWAFEMDPPDFRVPDEVRTLFTQHTLKYLARKAELQSQILAAQAEMLNAKAKALQ